MTPPLTLQQAREKLLSTADEIAIGWPSQSCSALSSLLREIAALLAAVPQPEPPQGTPEGLCTACSTEPCAEHALPDLPYSFQGRVNPWLQECFGHEIAADKVERNHRFIEEALELVQSAGCTRDEAHQLVDYVFGRSAGQLSQEAGGVMVTLAALCLANGIDMHECGETELARVWTKVETIRAKQAAKPKHSPLPMASAPQTISTEAPQEPQAQTEPTDAEVNAAIDALAEKAKRFGLSTPRSSGRSAAARATTTRTWAMATICGLRCSAKTGMFAARGEVMTLMEILARLERWQQWERPADADALQEIDIPVARNAAHQHAEALRGIIEQLSDSMDADATVDEQLEAAAAFLEGTDA